jgi:D-aminopeptidase
MRSVLAFGIFFVFVPVLGAAVAKAQPDASGRPRARDIGLSPGVLPVGPLNAITDVPHVKVGQVTVWEGDSVRTGVTVILPHDGNVFQSKVPAAMHLGNAFGKLIGYTQVEELGFMESPVVLTNTLSVWDAANAVVTYLMGLAGNEDVRSFNPVVGETNDGYLNDIRGRHVREQHVLRAIEIAGDGPVQEGVVGAGTGTTAFGWKGGIGTSSRRLPETLGGHTVGVLVQSNYGGVLQMDGLPVGEELGRYYLSNVLEEDGTRDEDDPDGSIMMVVATDAPVRADGLRRIAKRAMLGLSRTGATSSNGSGDYVIAFSTAPELRSSFEDSALSDGAPVIRNDRLSPIFQATIEATEEAVYNSMLKAVSVTGRDGNQREALPIDRLLEIGRKYNRLHSPKSDGGNEG